MLRARIARDTATVAVAFRDPVRHEELLIDGLRRYHAASTVKVPVLDGPERNLATNLLIERSIPSGTRYGSRLRSRFDRGVARCGGRKAYQQGRNNTTTTRDLAVLLDAIARARGVFGVDRFDADDPARPGV
jgi:hypothetical protein